MQNNIATTVLDQVKRIFDKFVQKNSARGS